MVVHRSEKKIISGYYRHIIELLCTLFRDSDVAMQFVHHLPEFQHDKCYESGHNSLPSMLNQLNCVIANPQATNFDPNLWYLLQFILSTLIKKNLIDGQYSTHEQGFCKDRQFHHCLMQTEANNSPCILNRIRRRAQPTNIPEKIILVIP